MGDSLIWIALAGGEVFGVIFILLFVSWVIGVRKKSRDRQAIKQLVARVAKERAQRLDALRGILIKNYGLSGGEKERKAVTLLNSELRLINGFSNLYLKRDATAASAFDKSLHTSLDVFHELAAAEAAPDGETSEEVVADEQDVSEDQAPEPDGNPEDMVFLRSENKRLNEELRVTMETMSRMLNEYSTMFGSDGTKEVNAVMDVVEIDEEDGAEAPLDSEQVVETSEEVALDLSEVDEGAPVAPAEGAVDELLAEEIDAIVEDPLEAAVEEAAVAEVIEEAVAVSAEDLVDKKVDEPTDEATDELLSASDEVELDLTVQAEDKEMQEKEPDEPVEVLAESPADAPADTNEEIETLFDQDNEPAAGIDEDLLDLLAEDDADKKAKQ